MIEFNTWSIAARLDGSWRSGRRQGRRTLAHDRIGQNQMAVVHQMLEQNFGDAWVYGGKISIR